MRLLMTTDTVGGVWTYCRDLVGELLEGGAELMLVSVGRAPDCEQTAWIAATSTRSEGAFSSRHVTVPLEWMDDGAGAFAQSRDELLGMCADYEPELVHCNQFCYGALAVADRAGLPIPKVVAAHSDVLSWWRARHGAAMPESEWRTSYVAQVQAGLEGADVIVAPTMASSVDLRQSFAFSTDVRVIWNGRTTECAATTDAAALTGKRLQAVTCGRLWDEGKNAALLERMRVAPMPIVVAGAVHQHAQEQSAAKSDSRSGAVSGARDGNGVRYAGLLGARTLRKLMLESAVYIVTSRYEPFGLAAVEAALAGCAVVASDLASQREVWGGAAEFFASDDPEALSAVLEKLSNDPARLKEVALRCRRRALGEMSARRMVADYAALYREMMGRRNGLRGRRQTEEERVA